MQNESIWQTNVNLRKFNLTDKYYLVALTFNAPLLTKSKYS